MGISIPFGSIALKTQLGSWILNELFPISYTQLKNEFSCRKTNNQVTDVMECHAIFWDKLWNSIATAKICWQISPKFHPGWHFCSNALTWTMLWCHWMRQNNAEHFEHLNLTCTTDRSIFPTPSPFLFFNFDWIELSSNKHTHTCLVGNELKHQLLQLQWYLSDRDKCSHGPWENKWFGWQLMVNNN